MSGTINFSIPVLAVALVAGINASLLVLIVLGMVLHTALGEAHNYWRWVRGWPGYEGVTIWYWLSRRGLRAWARPLIWLVIVLYGLFYGHKLSKYRESVSR